MEGTRGSTLSTPPSRDDQSTRELRRQLLRWWRRHRRDFPWRRTRDPYKVLIAEILLRRTHAPQVVPVYSQFLEEYPNPAALAAAAADRIRGLLRPLGLRWRAENVIQLRGTLGREASHVFHNAGALRRLPGVGDYVSAAVRCFCFNERVPVVDTNTSRVIVRLFGISGRSEPRRNRIVRGMLQQLVRSRKAREINLALIDLAATVCLPRIPTCSRCPLVGICSKWGVTDWR
jgi:A/G-specific adenine glycosylase